MELAGATTGLTAHLPRQIMINDFLSDFAIGEVELCPFARASEQVRGVPFFKTKTGSITLVYNSEIHPDVAMETLDYVSELTGFEVKNSNHELSDNSILIAHLDASDYQNVESTLLKLERSKRSLLIVNNFNNIQQASYQVLSTLIERKSVNGNPISGLSIVLQETRKEKSKENSFAVKLRSKTMTINESN
jgi:hypothetical protein